MTIPLNRFYLLNKVFICILKNTSCSKSQLDGGEDAHREHPLWIYPYSYQTLLDALLMMCSLLLDSGIL